MDIDPQDREAAEELGFVETAVEPEASQDVELEEIPVVPGNEATETDAIPKADAGDDADDGSTEPDAGLANRAAQLGYSRDDIAALHRAGALDASVRNSERLVTMLLQPTGRAKSDADAVTPQDEPVEDEDEFKLELDIDEDEASPEYVKLAEQLKKVNEHHSTRYKKLREQNDALVQYARQTQQIANQSRFDALVSTVGETFADQLGKGPTIEMQTDSPEFKNRDAVYRHMAIVRSGYTANKLQPPDERTLFQQAVNAVLGHNQEQATVRKIAKQVSSQAKRNVSRPTHREPTPEREDPDRRAKQYLSAKAKELGIPDTFAEEEEDLKELL